MQLAKLYDVETLCRDARMTFPTLRRVLLAEHLKEPIVQLQAIARAPGWKKVDGAPRSLAGWRALWARTRRAPPES